jgi:hypothetical protein
MGSHRVIHKLETLWRNIGISAEIDPLVKQEAESIPTGTAISLSLQVKGIAYGLVVTKEDQGWKRLEDTLEFEHPVRIHCASYHHLNEFLHGSTPISEMVTKGHFMVQGESPVVMAIIRMIQYSSPYLHGMSKASNILSRSLDHQYYRKRRLVYRIHKLIPGGLEK